MKIIRICIRNYKSIKELEFKPAHGLNVFIGENNVGKSNIFTAINWLLGPTYPTVNSIKKEDRYLCKESNKIVVELDFDTGEQLSFDENAGGLKLNRSRYVKSEIRENFCCAYVDTKRTIVDYLPSDKWSLLGRILQDINKIFLKEEIEEDGQIIKKSERLKKELDQIKDDLLFSVKNDEGEKIMNNFINIIKKESAEQLNRSPEDFEVNLNLYDPWDFYRTLQIIVNEKDLDLKFQASQLGMGTQASITVAILRAYSEIKLGGGNPIFIDEPELFLHPQAQKNFYKILRKLSEEKEIQIFYTTHSPYFLSLENFDEIFLTKRTKDKGTYIKTAKPEKFLEDWAIRHKKDISDKSVRNKELVKLRLHYKEAYEQTSDSLSSAEAFFAKKIILVEGESEALLLPYLFNKINFDWIKERISIVKCGSKNELDRFYRLYVEFGIPCFVIFDGDKDKINKENHRKVNNGLFKILGESTTTGFPDSIVKNNYLGFENDFNYALQQAGFQNAYSDDNPEKSLKGLELFLRIKSQEDVAVPSWISEIKEKVLNLPYEIESVLIRKDTEDYQEINSELEKMSKDVDIDEIPF